MSNPHHTHKWNKLRSIIFKRSKGLCSNPFGFHSFPGMLTPKGQPTPATVVHHIIPIEVDYSHAFDPHNLTTLCSKCHDHAHALLDYGGVAGRVEYRKAFKLPTNIPLTSRQKSITLQPFFSAEKCRQLSDGEVYCARLGCIRPRPCSCCSHIKA